MFYYITFYYINQLDLIWAVWFPVTAVTDITTDTTSSSAAMAQLSWSCCKVHAFFRHEQAPHARLRRQEGSVADVNICSLTHFFPFPPYRVLFTVSTEVKGPEVIKWSSQLDAVSKIQLFLSANGLMLGRGLSFLEIELFNMWLQALLLYALGWLLRPEGNKGQSGQDFSHWLIPDQLTYY